MGLNAAALWEATNRECLLSRPAFATGGALCDAKQRDEENLPPKPPRDASDMPLASPWADPQIHCRS